MCLPVVPGLKPRLGAARGALKGGDASIGMARGLILDVLDDCPKLSSPHRCCVVACAPSQPGLTESSVLIDESRARAFQALNKAWQVKLRGESQNEMHVILHETAR